MAIRQSTGIVLGKTVTRIQIELPTGNDSVGFWCEAALSSTRNCCFAEFAQQKLILEWYCDKFFWFLNSQVPHSSCFGGGTVESCACGTSCAECLLAKKNSWINLIQLAKRLRWSSVPQQAQVKINLSSSDPLMPIDAYCTYCHCFLEFPYQPTRWDLEV